MGHKPSDRWCISLCKLCHASQHILGEQSFERTHGINLKALAEAFYRASPHKNKFTNPPSLTEKDYEA